MDDRLKMVRLCYNAYDGIAMIAKKTPGLVFLDVNMSGMTGPETLLQIPKAKLIVIIAHRRPGKPAKSSHSGFSHQTGISWLRRQNSEDVSEWLNLLRSNR